jgi:hypothetical protein
MVNRKDTGAAKTKLVKTCGVASVVPTAMMKKGFAESPIKKGYECKGGHSFFRSHFSKRILSRIFCLLE